jgi:RHS repeat-associated protein
MTSSQLRAPKGSVIIRPRPAGESLLSVHTRYDNEGNLTKKTKGTSAETWLYGYDNLDHLTSAKKYDKDPNNGGVLQQEVDYKYDYWGNRLEKDVSVSNPSTQRYAYDGWDPAKRSGDGTANFDVWADLDGNSSLTTRYIRGDVVDQLFARIGSDGTAAWLLTDHLGSVVGVTDNSGALLDTIGYDGYGNITTETASAYTGRYTYTGREREKETGWQYYRARYYDPATARWTSQDPIGFDAGDSNLYRYAYNQGTGHKDPSGLSVPRIAKEGHSTYIYQAPEQGSVLRSYAKVNENPNTWIKIGEVKGNEVWRLVGSYYYIAPLESVKDQADTFYGGCEDGDDWNAWFRDNRSRMDKKPSPAPPVATPQSIPSNDFALGNPAKVLAGANNVIGIGPSPAGMGPPLSDKAKAIQAEAIRDIQLQAIGAKQSAIQALDPALKVNGNPAGVHTPATAYTKADLDAAMLRVMKRLKEQQDNTHLLVFVPDGSKTVHVMGSIQEKDLPGLRDSLEEADRPRSGWEKALSILGNAATALSGIAMVALGPEAATKICGGFLIYRGGEGLIADLTDDERFTTKAIKLVTGNTALANGIELSMQLAELAIGLWNIGSNIPRMGAGLAPVTVRVPRAGLQFAGVGVGALGGEISITISVRDTFVVSARLAQVIGSAYGPGRFIVLHMSAATGPSGADSGNPVQGEFDYESGGISFPETPSNGTATQAYQNARQAFNAANP